VLDSEVNLVNWDHPIGRKFSLNASSEDDKKHYLKVFKTWRQSKKTGGPARDDLRVAYRKFPEHLAESWEAFLKKCAAGNISVKEPKAKKEKVCILADKKYIDNVRKEVLIYLAT
jgi:hypothetical protein